MTITEGNKIIALSQFRPDEVQYNITHFAESGNEVMLNEYLNELKFHSSWDWLMPVVEKITEIGFQCQLTTFKSRELADKIAEYGFRVSAGNKIISFKENSIMINVVYESVIEFIEWLNTEEL